MGSAESSPPPPMPEPPLHAPTHPDADERLQQMQDFADTIDLRVRQMILIAQAHGLVPKDKP